MQLIGILICDQDDRVLVNAAAFSVGSEGLKALVNRFTTDAEWLNAAKTQYALATISEGRRRFHFKRAFNPVK